jgi:uncharacterized protein YbjT (DUF2867 family)
MRIAVAGGTGVVGRHVVAALTGSGHEVVVVARSRGVDVTTGQGLDAALAGADAVIDVSNVATTRRKQSVAFFESATRHLLGSGERAGVAHHVALSIVGSDRVDLGYYAGKRRQEELVLTGPVPGTVLRATQFHEFAELFLGAGRAPVAVVPRLRCQPVAAREVAAALVELATGPAAGQAPELAGPREEELADMVRQLARARGRRRRVVGVRLPGRAGGGMAHGALLPTAPGPRGRQTFAEWCADARQGPPEGSP